RPPCSIPLLHEQCSGQRLPGLTSSAVSRGPRSSDQEVGDGFTCAARSPPAVNDATRRTLATAAQRRNGSPLAQNQRAPACVPAAPPARRFGSRKRRAPPLPRVAGTLDERSGLAACLGPQQQQDQCSHDDVSTGVHQAYIPEQGLVEPEPSGDKDEDADR